jgi:hypothetical protein
MSRGHSGDCQRDIEVLTTFVKDIAHNLHSAGSDRVAALRCLASIGAQPRAYPSDDCDYCGQPRNSAACQKSHP